ncbi:MAG: hypothetical protein KGI71_03770 [Patescibacteria group bacterium]|nr:hypothetical protein [Patescibacteria group bacterium]
MNTTTPNDFGKSFLIDECRRISVWEVMSRVREKMKRALLDLELSTLDVQIGLTMTKTPFGGMRYWFVCPLCSKRVGTLFVHPLSEKLGCRTCLGLEYRKRRYKGMPENV